MAMHLESTYCEDGKENNLSGSFTTFGNDLDFCEGHVQNWNWTATSPTGTQ